MQFQNKINLLISIIDLQLQFWILFLSNDKPSTGK